MFPLAVPHPPKAQHAHTAVNVGDEGGFAPNIQDNREGLELLKQAIDQAGYTGKVVIGMDVAASEFFKEGKYDLDFKNKDSDPSKWLTGEQLAELYISFTKDYPVVSIEDPFDQDDFDSYNHLTSQVSNQIVGDDLTVTNPKRIQLAIDKKACNALLLKVNQIGSLSESIQAYVVVSESGRKKKEIMYCVLFQSQLAPRSVRWVGCHGLAPLG